jgi:beta-galactosidase
MVLSARNSACVIMWSIGNEIPRRATPEGVEWSWRLANRVRTLDPTRPVTAAIHGTLGPTLIPAEGSARTGREGQIDNAATVFLDVPGYNYRLNEIEFEHDMHPERVVYASETFARDVFDYARLMDRAPYFLGEFLWTATDYIGEAAIGRSETIQPGTSPYALQVWPYTNANCGDIDLTGAQKPSSLARDVAWGLSLLEVLVHRPLPAGMQEFITNWGWPDEQSSWTWRGEEGKPLSVRACTAGDPYTPGLLEVVARKSGRVIARKALTTTGSPARLHAAVEPHRGRLDRQALLFVPITVLDDHGRTVPDAQVRVALRVSGPAELVAFGSANPKNIRSLQAPETETFRGRGLAILRSTGASGAVRISIESAGLAGATITTGFA